MANSTPQPRPPDSVLQELSRACQRNAGALLDEADLLIARGHYSRALALAHTAREEAAKVQLLGEVLESAFPWEQFITVFRDHKCKYAFLNRTVAFSDPSGKDAVVSYDRKLGDVDFARRQRALFVDLDGDRIIEPTAISKEEASAAIRDARHEIQGLTVQRFLAGGTGSRSAIKGLPTLDTVVPRKPER